MQSKRRALARSGAAAMLAFSYLVSGCPGGGDVDEALKQTTFSRLEPFASDSEFDDWRGKLAQARDRQSGWGVPFGCAAESPASREVSSAPPAAGGDESITNNQESGVDEGDIVKAAGDYLIVLRRGRLFTLRVGDAGRPDLAPRSAIPAYPAGSKQGTWYDEMLVHRDRVVVVGFSYRVGATEIGLFRLAPDGSLAHEATYFLRSNDYYSSRNYASRLVNGTLIFYMPYFLWSGASNDSSLPALAPWTSGDEPDFDGVLPRTEIYKPIQPVLSPTLHTVVRCDLDQPAFGCTARAVVGPYSRTFYVSQDAVYVWVSPGYETWRPPSADAGAQPDPDPSVVYRLPLDASGPVTALRARGGPVDQFSFDEGADGHLNVVLAGTSRGDWMGNPETTSGPLALLRAPLSRFSESAPAADETSYTALPSPRSASLQNRFVGDWVLWGAGTGWGWGSDGDTRLYAARVHAPGRPEVVELGHTVERIEALGKDAVVVGLAGGDLHFSSLALLDRVFPRGRYVRPDASQGETRSHGFFFKADAQGGGTLGLPVRLDGAPYRQLRYGSAEVDFVRVGPTLALTPLGALAARADQAGDDGCEMSCVDWYGNARPIFYRGRVLALLGYELVEGTLGADALVEARRVDFGPP